ncbi:MAG: GntR family transcriptional regulator [Lachnospiraceae bacterium]|nr:GntR family transcriptional regulator [Lachnospiraceae bacterium]MBO4788169.1 GntR family transcriptional regulator [Lachnospiraceae bacterium]MBQ2031327.1 GntR family transcriptional regulator [Lachnospiraceae bacterium]MBQ2558521.1 GntR family transcriptional regulator [Lachnospiraceae bacterium]MBQ3979657.1 GntR family transcriptional regulator [Lachnospiraceae bacterium]
MLISIDFNSDEAFYMQLRNQIIMGIATSEIRDGENLPSVRDLADTVGINMHTVNKAYTILKQEGYLKLDRRHGAVVSVDVDRQRAIEELRTQLREAVARAVCRNVSEKDINAILNEVVEEFR